jgi:hypothetical protein
MCYASGASFKGAQDLFTQLSHSFNNGNINNLFGLDQFPPGDTEALVLGAKMSLFQVNLYQQLIMLGSARGENATLKAFAATAAQKLQERYDYLTNIDQFRAMVSNYSTMTNGTFGNMGEYSGTKLLLQCALQSQHELAIDCWFLYVAAHACIGIALASDPVAYALTQETLAPCLAVGHRPAYICMVIAVCLAPGPADHSSMT